MELNTSDTHSMSIYVYFDFVLCQFRDGITKKVRRALPQHARATLVILTLSVWPGKMKPIKIFEIKR